MNQALKKKPVAAKPRAQEGPTAMASKAPAKAGGQGGGATQGEQGDGHSYPADTIAQASSGAETNSPYCPTFILQIKKQERWKAMKNPEPGGIA